NAYSNLSIQHTDLKVEVQIHVAKIPDELVAVMIYSQHEDSNAMDVDLSWPVSELKNQISRKFGTPILQQCLFFKGDQLFDEAPLAFYHIMQATAINMVIYESGKECTSHMFENKEFFENEFNADFTKLQDDGTQYTRGGRPYFRPFGSFRYGINLRKMKDMNDPSWLGRPGHRTDSTPGEWPVAYHGTREINAGKILEEGFRLDKCIRFAYGKGIYCSPDPNTALSYADPFKYKV
uniref:Ubiquitin-like domain-containing protein n=1 Tax=Acrobeloides nanus TaxID=290746 RepID=A0A914DDT2_9BILA